MNKLLTTCIISSVAFISLAASAQEPALNVSGERHGNLAAAQQAIRVAYDRIGDAQAANKDELGGHAARAKELLRDAANEVKLAAETANHK